MRVVALVVWPRQRWRVDLLKESERLLEGYGDGGTRSLRMRPGRAVLFHAHDGERTARDHDAPIGRHIPPDSDVDRIAVRTLR